MRTAFRDEQPDGRKRPLLDMRMSRRGFMLVATAGVLAACEGAPAQTPVATTQTTPARRGTPAPLQLITPGNAPRLTRVALLEPQKGAVRTVAWSSDGRLLVVGAYAEIQVWDVQTQKKISTLQGHTGQVYALHLSPNGETLISGSDDGSVRLWETKTWTPLTTLVSASRYTIFSTTWSPDGSKVVLGYADGTVQVWDIKKRTQRLLEGHVADNPRPDAVYGLAWAPGGNQIVSTRYDSNIFVWDAGTGQKLATLHPSSLPNAVAFAPTGNVLASSSDDGTVQLWEASTHTLAGALQGHGDSGWAYPMAWSPDGRLLAAGREDGLMQVWDVASKQELAGLSDSRKETWGLAWSPDGKLIATGNDDEMVRLWGV